VVITKHKWTPEDRIIEMIAWMLNIPSSQINPFTDLVDDLYLDSIDRVLLIAKLESQFGVYLSKEEVASIETVRDASTYFLRKHAA
jgi:acyl carrier protein